MRACKNCQFWNFGVIGYQRPTGETRGIADHMECQCRRHAPIVVDARSLGRTDTAFINVWPETHGNEWCGDFKIIPELEPCPKCGKPIGTELGQCPDITQFPYFVCKECSAKLKFPSFWQDTKCQTCGTVNTKALDSSAGWRFYNNGPNTAVTYTCPQCPALPGASLGFMT